MSLINLNPEEQFPPQIINGGFGSRSIVPPSGGYGPGWRTFESIYPIIPEGLSSAKWTLEARGVTQQTFLGGSIRNFSMNGGFGDSSSSLTVELVNDEYNKSDGTTYGVGVDEYHGGQKDFILPPIPGTPVFFKFGESAATVDEAYRKIFDLYSGYNTTGFFNVPYVQNPSDTLIPRYGPNKTEAGYSPLAFTSLETGEVYDLNAYRNIHIRTPWKGINHVTFGGILQSFLQNRGPAGNPLYSVQVVDPREILSNVSIILNNYAGSTFGEKNIFNVYGFLEFNVPPATQSVLNSFGTKNILQKEVHPVFGSIDYRGTFPKTINKVINGRTYATPVPLDSYVRLTSTLFGPQSELQSFPITGTGFSRRSSQGIPWYRVYQAMNALMEINFDLPQIYKNANFSGMINFRGHNYVIDFSGLPKLPDMYFLDFDQINLLDLCLEICDVTNRELFVSLLPVINHPACGRLFGLNYANRHIKEKFISGIIRIDTIDRSVAPKYGAIKTYIDNLAKQGIVVENQDVGYELSNVTTNKFVAGAQEVEHYFFSGNHDRDLVASRRGISQTVSMYQWLLENQSQQQILPFYGFLGKNAVTIPKGWGAYQQILLDTTGLDANGVGSYYVATEMELRFASISYQAWSEFLMTYNDLYMEPIDGDNIIGNVLTSAPNLVGMPAVAIQKNYAVTVPRSVFDTYAKQPFTNGLPTSACNPPYGYPLYYKRATKIGIPAGGFTKVAGRLTAMITASAKGAGADRWVDVRDSVLAELDSLRYDESMSPTERNYYNRIRAALALPNPNIEVLNDVAEGIHRIQAILPRLAKKGLENSMKVYNFVKKIADENLGKKFLVKMPQKVNAKWYSQIIMDQSGNYDRGPFGFKPIAISNDIRSQYDANFWGMVRSQAPQASFIKVFLSDDSYGGPGPTGCVGALKCNFNPISDKYEFNYTPTNLGGFFAFDLYSNILSPQDLSRIPYTYRSPGVNQRLIPQDLSNFITPEGRISPYVRFDHSQNLALHLLNAEDYTQQVIPQHELHLAMMPDLAEAMENTQDDNISFTQANANRPDNFDNTKACAFVKCSVDENFYMAPRIQPRQIPVYGRPYATNKISKPHKIYIQCSGWAGGIPGTSLVPGTGIYVDSYRYIDLHIKPDTGGMGSATRFDYVRYFDQFMNSYIVDTNIQNLDTSGIYALITLPNKIVPTKISRYREAMNFNDQHWDVHHYLTMDVVKGLPEFNTPAYLRSPGLTKFFDVCRNFGSQAKSQAWLAANAAKRALKYAAPNVMQYTVPSPVYPDLVALPLISNDRCYGPWISTYFDVQGAGFMDVGGRIEFVKDENLAPWNYGGYDLMNEAGSLQASFANNLLLFSERGGFTFPGLPSTSLAQALIEGGPLVTNISVDVSEAGVKTTYKMDLYTSSFGKLQKQKQELISKISRERQKLREERNSLIRKGLGKAQTSFGIGNINQSASIGDLNNVRNISPTHLVASLSRVDSGAVSSVPGLNFGASEEGEEENQGSPITITDHINDAAMQTAADINHTTNQFDNTYDRETAMSDAGASKLSDIWIPYSEAPFHPSLPNMVYKDEKARKNLFG